MKNYGFQLIASPLFIGINEEEIETILACINARALEFKKDEIILMPGARVEELGLVLTGRVQISKEDIFGNVSILSMAGQGEVFGEVLSLLESKKSPVMVKAELPCTILFVNFQNMLHNCSKNCEFHSQLVKNMLFIMAQKNVIQNFKIEILSKKGIRERVIAYLLNQWQCNQSRRFDVPFNREGMADFLCVDRSALSKELSNMKNEEKIDYHKNSFLLKDNFFGKR